MSVYLVTGAAGFIGSHIAEELITRGDEVVILDDLSAGTRNNINTRATFINGSILDTALITATCRKYQFEGIFHLAAVASVKKSIEKPLYVHNVNTTGTVNILEAARTFDINKVVLSASAAAYGDAPEFPKQESMKTSPLSPYATSKIAAELYLKNYSDLYGMHNTALRYFNVFGPRQDPNGEYAAVISKFAEHITKKEPITIYGDGKQTRDFVFVKDVVLANLLAMDSSDAKTADLFNIGTGLQTSLNDLAEMMMDAVGYRVPVNYQPVRDGDIRFSYADISKAQKILKYSPQYTLRNGLKLTLDSFKYIKS